MENIFLALIALVAVMLLMIFIVKYPRMQVYLYFLFGCILPSYFAIEISDSLPLITGTRFLIILLMVYAFTHKKSSSLNIALRDQKLMVIICTYFICRIVAELTFLPTIPGNAIKELFVIVFEQFLVIYLIVRVVNNRTLFDKCLNLLAYGALLICIVGIIQSLTSINLAYYLNTVNRTMLQTSALRLGFTRAEASFGHPVYFGEFCVLMLPVFSYLYDYKKKNKYMCFLLIDIVALILSNSRGAILPGVIILLLMIIQKSRKVRWKYIAVFLCGAVGVIFMGILIPSAGETFGTIIKSILNIFGKSFELGDYGGNVSGLESRTDQLSGILWVIMNGVTLFGFGPDAHMRGYVRYYFNGRWNKLETIDVGYVGFFLCEGLVGTIGQLVLIFGLIVKAYEFSRQDKINNANKMFLFIFLAYALLLLSATGLGIAYWTIIGLFIAYNNILGYESKSKRGKQCIMK